MAVHPVIMCGGSGVRLWPASRPERPKPFIPLVGDRSGFQAAVLRVAGVAGAARPLVIGGAAHADLIAGQLAAIGVAADILLEPAPRDSAAAMAAAALHVLARDPQGVLAVVSADHHIPAVESFRAAISTAAEAAVRDRRIVTLGVTPTEPATAYGYIRPGPGDAAVRPVAAFIEKPDLATAEALIASGHLWNSGNFIASAALLAEELERFAPEVLAAARKALVEARPQGAALVLGNAFLGSPRISIDYAVMEKTDRAAVLAYSGPWSDLGAWNAALAAAERDASGNTATGDAVLSDTSDSLVRAGSGVRVTTLGVTGLGVIADGGEVLVTALDRSQDLKALVDGLGAPRRFASLSEASAWFDLWLRTAALPLWWSLGADHARGGFLEALSPRGEPRPGPRRGRVQGRQVFVYAQGGALGWAGPWRQAARHGLDYMLGRFLRPDGLIRTLVSLDGAPLDETAAVYDQAFALLGMASLHAVDPGQGELVAAAERLRRGLDALRHPRAGFREAGDQPFQANAHMHMFEAALEWAEAGEASWDALADEIADLALGAFIDERGVLREFFDAEWRPKSGDDGRLVEPGHQFEWAWLLERWGRRCDRPEGLAAAKQLYAVGRRGVDPRRGAAMNALWDDFTLRDDGARLWPQTEHLKAALALGAPDEALQAANCLKLYLEVPALGAWRDKFRPDLSFVEESSPATSFYHIICACRALFEEYPPQGR